MNYGLLQTDSGVRGVHTAHAQRPAETACPLGTARVTVRGLATAEPTAPEVPTTSQTATMDPVQ